MRDRKSQFVEIPHERGEENGKKIKTKRQYEEEKNIQKEIIKKFKFVILSRLYFFLRRKGVVRPKDLCLKRLIFGIVV
jgi:hypothetical protein